MSTESKQTHNYTGDEQPNESPRVPVFDFLGVRPEGTVPSSERGIIAAKSRWSTSKFPAPWLLPDGHRRRNRRFPDQCGCIPDFVPETGARQPSRDCPARPRPMAESGGRIPPGPAAAGPAARSPRVVPLPGDADPSSRCLPMWQRNVFRRGSPWQIFSCRPGIRACCLPKFRAPCHRRARRPAVPRPVESIETPLSCC